MRKGRRVFTRPPAGFYGRGWHPVKMRAVRVALFAFSSLSLVCVVGHVFELEGSPIGGLLSFISLACVLVSEEMHWKRNLAAHQALGFDFAG